MTSAASAPISSMFGGVAVGAGRQREHGVAVHLRVHRVDGAGEAVVSHLRDLGGLCLGQRRVGGDDGQRRLLARLRRISRSPARSRRRASANVPSSARAPATI